MNPKTHLLASLSLVVISFLPCSAQMMTNKGEAITVLPATSIYVQGDFVNDNSQLILTGYSSIFRLTGSLTNNSPFNIVNEANSSGFVIFDGSGKTISGSSSFLKFISVTINGSTTLQHTITVSNSLTLNNTLDIGNYSINLLNSGHIDNETSSNRIYSNGSGKINYILPQIPTLSDATGGIGLRMEGPILGGAAISRGHAIQTNAGDGSISRYFDINLNAGDEIQKVRFYYFDNEIPGSINEVDLQIYISFDGGVNWKKIGGVVDTSSNFVELSGLSITDDVRLTLSGKNCIASPIVNLGAATQNLCAGTSLTLDAGNPGDFYTWSNSATTQAITTTVAGSYSVIVRDPKGCEGTGGVMLVERPTPSVAFTTGYTCPNEMVNFTNGSTISSGTIAYLWEFGDPATTIDNSTNDNPSYTYTVAADYSVSLTATSDYNCTANLTKTVTIYPTPQVDFTFADACLGHATSFTNASTIAYGGMTYDWDFGDGTSSTQISPAKAFSSISSFTVSLTATSNANCVSSVSKNVDIHYTPTADFGLNNVCELIGVPFTNASTITNGTLSYQWDFGDGTNSTTFEPSKSYLNAGNYSVTLTAISDFSCSSQLTKSIDIYANPVANFSVVDNCQNQLFNFLNGTIFAQGTVSYSWNFGDGDGSAAINPTKSYDVPGAFNVSLTASTSLGCVNTFTQTVNVFPVPVADFNVSNACQDAAFNFMNGTSLAFGSLTHQWDFGDSNTSGLPNPSKNYAAAGIYQVSLVSTSDKGCVNSKTKEVEVYPMPVLDLGGSITTCGISYTFDALNEGSFYLWSDGSTDRTYTARDNGTYFVTVTTVNNCSITESVNIILNGDVIPNLGPDRIICGGTQLSAGYPGSNYAWSNGNTTQKIDVITSGNYSVAVTDQNGCIGYDDVNVTINPIPIVNLGADIVVCSNQSVVLDAQNSGSSYLWSDNSVAQTLSPKVTGIYAVEVINQFNCKGTDNINVTINPMPVNILPATLFACDRLTLDAGNAGADYLWTNNATSQKTTITTSGVYGVTITTAQNCSITVNSNITINPSPPVNLGSDQSLCFGQSTILEAGNAGDSYKWSNGSTGKTLLVDKNGLYWVEVRRTTGCLTRDSIVVTIFPKLTNSLKSNYQLCANEPRVLDATSPQGFTYQWFGANGFLSSEPSISVTTAGKYQVITKDQLNCLRIDTVKVNVDPDPITARFLAASLVNVGDSVKFIQLAYPDPVSFYWDFADGITSTQSDPVHRYLRSGDFNSGLLTKDANGCRDIKSKTITVRLLRDDNSVAVASPFFESTYSLYPNPATDNIKLELDFNRDAEIQVVLYSMDGRIIAQKNSSVQSDIIEFDLHSQPPGIYILRIWVNREMKEMRFIKI